MGLLLGLGEPSLSSCIYLYNYIYSGEGYMGLLLGLGEPSRTPSIGQSVHTETTDCNSDISVITSIRYVSVFLL